MTYSEEAQRIIDLLAKEGHDVSEHDALEVGDQGEHDHGGEGDGVSGSELSEA